jgi:hypothetical protein
MVKTHNEQIILAFEPRLSHSYLRRLTGAPTANVQKNVGAL